MVNIIQTITSPIQSLWQRLLYSLPGILAMVLILIIGYIIAVVLGIIVEKLLHKLNADKWLLEKTSMSKLIGKFKLSRFLGLITKWYVFVMFLPAAANAVQLSTWASFLNDLAKWIPNVIVGVIIALVGILAADYVSTKITELKAKGAGAIALATKTIIIIFAALMALRQVGVDVRIAESTFLIVLSGIMLALALMFGIGFGLAMKEEAKSTIKKVKKKL